MADGDPQRPREGGEADQDQQPAGPAEAPGAAAASPEGFPAPSRDPASAADGPPAADTTVDATARVAGAFTDVAVKVIAALGTTAGFITLVAGTGGAVMLARFWAAGLPADQALAAMPRNDLVAAGAAALGLFALLGLVAVAGVYAIDAAGRATKSMRVGLSALVGAEIICAVLIATDDLVLEGAAVVWCLGLVAVAFYVRKTGRYLEEREPDPPTLADLRDARERERLGGHPLVREPRRQLKSKALVIATVFAVLSAGLGWVFYGQAVAAAVIVSSGLAAICFGVAEASGTRFWPYALSVFFSVALFGAVFSTWRLAESPKLNPVALLRVSEGRTSGVIGLLVARREDRYWLGAVTLQCEDGQPTDQGVPHRGRIFSIPRGEVKADEIGALIPLKDADHQARALLRELIRRHPEAQNPGSAEARIKPRTLEPPGVSSCSRDVPTGNGPPRAAVAVRRHQGDPGLWLLDATVSQDDGAIRRFDWRLEDDVTRRRPVIRVRAPVRRPDDVVIRLRVQDDAGLSDAVEVRLRPPLSSTALFRINRAVITPRGRRILVRQREALRDARRVYVEGHTDDTGRESHNQDLSERRADAVADVLVDALRLPREAIVSRGFGERLPAATNENPGGRRLNRRVEVLVVRR